ncbi:MAG: sigma-54-dependent Fis family transcriptional regulator [Candidatus Eisenbacteria bacterium]|nr:sigma-54-dependent Fis family transcriptional regulator [Candidatus Eisenbacteria bacterium]
MRKLLIADDDVAVTNYLMVFLMQTERYEPTVINNSKDIPDLLEREVFDAILLDMDMPQLSGMDVLKLVHDKGLETPVIVLTGVNDVDLAVKALKLGAFDYLTKPVEDDYLLEVLDKAITQRALRTTIRQIPDRPRREDLAHEEAFAHLPTRSESMIQLFHQAEKMAAGDLNVFIFGERGVGKESMARAIHAASPRAKGPLVSVDVAAHDPERFAADFFGQAEDWKGEREVRPGFLEGASEGTLFINNVEELPRPVQIRLLRVMQKKEFYRESSTRTHAIDVRIIAASCHELGEEQFRDAFSPDLFHHLMVHSIRLIPLRERAEDIPVLAEHFLAQEAARQRKNIVGFEPRMLDLLVGYAFPGNLQELHDIIATSVINTEGDRIGVDTLSPYLRDRILAGGAEEEPFHARSLAEVEREHGEKTLRHFQGNRARAAAALGIDEESLRRILEGNGGG